MGNFSSSSSKTMKQYTWESSAYTRSTGVTLTASGSVLDSQTSLVYSASRSGGKTPNYRSLVKNGSILPVTSLSYEKILAPNAQGAILEYFTSSSTGWYRERRQVLAANVYVPSIPANPFSDNELATRLIKKAKGAQWSLPVFLGELAETAGMVGKAARHLAEMAYALRKGNIIKFFNMFHPKAKAPRERALRRAKRKFDKNFGRDPASAASGAWLEYQYGWKPFLKDVYDAFETLSELQDKPINEIGTVRTRLTSKRLDVLGPTRITSWGDVLMDGEIRTEWELSGSAVWSFRPLELNTLGKLGLTNPLSVAWELTTLSFVVDWFIPIGDYLDALDVPMRFSHVSGAYGFRASSRTYYYNPRPQDKSWKLLTWSDQESKRLSVSRRPMTGLPSLKLADLQFKANLGLSQATSAVALLQQAIKGLSRKGS